MKILLTGSEGFIGKHVKKLLNDTGRYVSCADKVGDRPIDLVYAADHGYMESDPECIIHCAAHADVKDNWSDEGQYLILRNNTLATRFLLHWASKLKNMKRFIFISSSAVYAESMLGLTGSYCVASSPYAASKLAGEASVQAYAHKYGWEWHVVRPAACVGPGYHHGHIADFVRSYERHGVINALDDGSRESFYSHVDYVSKIITLLATSERSSEILPKPNVHNAVQDKWSWVRTIEVMSEMAGYDVKFNASANKRGWVGDFNGGNMEEFTSIYDMYHDDPKFKTIEDGVREALCSLNWPSIAASRKPK